MTRRAAAIGECLIDLIAPSGADLLTAPDLQIREGGAPANVAVALSRLGVPTRLHAVVGDDPFGERLRRKLAEEGVETDSVRVAPGVPTTIALAWADERGNGHFRLHRHADVLLSPEDVGRDALADASVVIAGSVAMAAEPSKSAVLTALAAANDLGIPVVVDLNIRPGLVSADEMRMNVAALITSATVVKLSVDDARELWGATSIAETLQALERFDPPIAVITDGGRGAALRAGGETFEEVVFPVEAVEPTGAGDAFTAAFIARMLDNGWHGAGVDDLRFAMAAGALATTRPGAMDGLPNREQVVAFLAEQDAR